MRYELPWNRDEAWSAALWQRRQFADFAPRDSQNRVFGGRTTRLRPCRLQCKWGRHCCRPHSHRRVDDPRLRCVRRTLPHHSLRAILGARCLIPARPILRLAPRDLRHATAHQGFVTGARAGIRLSLLPCRVPHPPEGFDFRRHAQLLGRDRVPLPIRVTARFRLAPFPRSPSRPGHPACPVKLRRALLKRACLHLA